MFCTHDELIATKAKVAKINKRAEKGGLSGRLEVTFEPKEFTHTTPSGLSVTQEGFEVSITGNPPKYEGWAFVARLEWDEDSGLVVFTAPGITEAIDRTNLVEGACDHCKINRYRKNVYLLRSDDGETIQVGSACIKDFLGISAMPVFISTDDISEESLFEGMGTGRCEPSFATEDVMSAAWACIQQFGYVRSNDWENGTPTKSAVLSVLDPRTKSDREISDEVRPHISDAAPMGKIIRDFILSDEFNGHNDYVINLKNIAHGDFVRAKNFGFIVSAPQAWAKAQERSLIQKREREEILNEWNGAVGDKLTVTVTLKSINHIDTMYGVSHLYTFTDEEGHLYKWFSSNSVFTTVDDTPITLKGRVKKLDEYNGVKATMLNYCKVV